MVRNKTFVLLLTYRRRGTASTGAGFELNTGGGWGWGGGVQRYPEKQFGFYERCFPPSPTAG